MGRRKKSEEQQLEEQTAAQPGHNSALTDAERQALFIRGITDLEAHIEEKDEVVAAIRSQRKRIISYGFDAFEIDFALKLRKSDDAEMMDKRRREAQIAQFLNHPIGSQLDWIDQVDRTPAVDTAYAEGKIAGARGESCKSPHDPSTPQDQSWLRGWHEGQADLASGFKKLEAEAEQEAEAELEEA